MRKEYEMNHMVRGVRSVPALPVSVPRRLPREARERIAEEVTEAYISATRVEGAAWVASEGITRLGIVSELAVRQSAADPHWAAHYAAIVDDLTVVVRQNVRRLGDRP
jgi:hypothetical protein